jgi:hypothetical protein
MSDNPNPQGKGLVPILAVLAEGRSAARLTLPKQIEQVSIELFTSLFVLESDCKFRPIAGQSYSLYKREGRFWLSRVAPDQWDESAYGQFIGQCQLHRDMTWTLELSEEAERDAELVAYIRDKKEALDEKIRSVEALEDILPGYNEELPFYQRAHSYALAHSLRHSMQQSGIVALSFSQAKGLLGPAGDQEQQPPLSTTPANGEASHGAGGRE